MHRYFREPVNSLTHLIGAVLALAGLIWLLVITYPDIDRVIVSIVYGISVILTFTASGVMHLYKGSNRVINLLIRLDHAAIYIMIAGSYTPIAYVFLDTFWFVWMMIAIWGMALAESSGKFSSSTIIRSLLCSITSAWDGLVSY